MIQDFVLYLSPLPFFSSFSFLLLLVGNSCQWLSKPLWCSNQLPALPCVTFIALQLSHHSVRLTPAKAAAVGITGKGQVYLSFCVPSQYSEHNKLHKTQTSCDRVKLLVVKSFQF